MMCASSLFIIPAKLNLPQTNLYINRFTLSTDSESYLLIKKYL
jgi:hypothetical protein